VKCASGDKRREEQVRLHSVSLITEDLFIVMLYSAHILFLNDIFSYLKKNNTISVLQVEVMSSDI
jgi:hypothetical protein